MAQPGDAYPTYKFITDQIRAKYSFSTANLYVNSTDVPALADVDGDGKIDILAFDVAGGGHQLLPLQKHHQRHPPV